MSRIGRKPLHLPSSVSFEQSGNLLRFTGPKGTLEVLLPDPIRVEAKDSVLSFTRQNDIPATRALHGLVRRLSQNAVTGVTDGFSKSLQLVGTGYRVALQGGNLVLSLGFSHPINFTAVAGVAFAVEGNNKIKVVGIDKQLVGQVAANIRKLRPPEPYKGKGIRYSDEVIRRKPGKAAAKTA